MTDSEIDELFQLPLDEFTAARNTLAAALKKAGRDPLAAEVKALAKPPLSAWVVNQLYWRHRKAFDALIDAGERFRKAQASQLRSASSTKAADMKAPSDARGDALSSLTKRAAQILEASGHPGTPDVQRRMTSTLEALASYGRAGGAPPAGYLTDDVQPPGFEVLASLARTGSTGATGANGAKGSRVIPFKPRSAKRRKISPTEQKRLHEQERKAAQKAIADAQQALREAKAAAAKAEAALKKAAARATQADKAMAAIEQRLEKLTSEAEAARLDARRVAAQAEEAAQAVDDAERALSLLRSRPASRQTSE